MQGGLMEKGPLGAVALCVSLSPLDQVNLLLKPPHHRLPTPIKTFLFTCLFSLSSLDLKTWNKTVQFVKTHLYVWLRDNSPPSSMIDVTYSTLMAAGSTSPADGLFITSSFNCPFRTLKCHWEKLLRTCNLYFDGWHGPCQHISTGTNHVDACATRQQIVINKDGGLSQDCYSLHF